MYVLPTVTVVSAAVNFGADPGLRADSVFQAFAIRAVEIIDKAYNPKGALNDGSEFLRGLDNHERRSESSVRQSKLLIH